MANSNAQQVDHFHHVYLCEPGSVELVWDEAKHTSASEAIRSLMKHTGVSTVVEDIKDGTEAQILRRGTDEIILTARFDEKHRRWVPEGDESLEQILVRFDQELTVELQAAQRILEDDQLYRDVRQNLEGVFGTEFVEHARQAVRMGKPVYWAVMDALRAMSFLLGLKLNMDENRTNLIG